jgi:stearoyl-CoA desaturase (delta-9 desaturase)
MFSMNKFWEKFFYVFTFITQGSSFLNPKAYAIMHRMHHAYSDTEKDPHSPYNSKNIFSMMWKTRIMYNNLVYGKADILEKFKKNIPTWPKLDKFAESHLSRYGWGLAYVVIYVLIISVFKVQGTHPWMYAFLPLHFIIGPMHGAIVNYFGHKLGYQNYDNHDKSKNTLFWDFLMGGELFQNNHHKYGARPNFATRWFEIDPTYPIMKVLQWVKIIKLKKEDPSVLSK